jgi:Putative ATPase subunit of terminase (gpP-like)
MAGLKGSWRPDWGETDFVNLVASAFARRYLLSAHVLTTIIASTDQEEHLTMAKRKKMSKPSPTPAVDASAQPAQESTAKPTRKSARKPAAGPARKSARKSARTSRPKKHLSRADRTRILAEAKSKGWTAGQIARKAGVSKWTVYGWKKRGAKPGAGKRSRPGRKAASGTPRRVSGALQSDFREMISEIVREEIGRLLGGAR